MFVRTGGADVPPAASQGWKPTKPKKFSDL
jgi:hypothetical protein